MVITNPAFGIWPKEERAYSSIGSLISASRKKGDGWWCPHCFLRGVFHWIDKHNGNLSNLRCCGICRGVSGADMEEVKEVMVGR